MYYRAREIAINNGMEYHLAAILRRGKSIVKIGTNNSKTSPRFIRTYPDGTTGSHLHAEMDVLRFSKPGDVIEVIRWNKTGMTMAKPCSYCQQFLKDAGIKHVIYTDWDGTKVKMKI